MATRVCKESNHNGSEGTFRGGDPPMRTAFPGVDFLRHVPLSTMSYKPKWTPAPKRTDRCLQNHYILDLTSTVSCHSTCILQNLCDNPWGELRLACIGTRRTTNLMICKEWLCVRADRGPWANPPVVVRAGSVFSIPLLPNRKCTQQPQYLVLGDEGEGGRVTSEKWDPVPQPTHPNKLAP